MKNGHSAANKANNLIFSTLQNLNVCFNNIIEEGLTVCRILRFFTLLKTCVLEYRGFQI